jgi:hypothetical protein
MYVSFPFKAVKQRGKIMLDSNNDTVISWSQPTNSADTNQRKETTMFNSNCIVIPPVRGSRIEKILKLSAMRRHLWTKACERDGIKPTSAFVIFSDENRVGNYWINRAANLMFKLMEQEREAREAK